ncbi:MAG: dual specificity protein phosphatase family protein [Sedimentisphaerales bacterium]|nr:dual specificity protein phosphatase family protein [Sedimentisphaerales bacterium]
MTEQSRQKSYQASKKRRKIIIRLIVVLLICAAVFAITAHLNCRNFWTSRYSRNYNDPNFDAIDKTNWAQRLDFPGLPNFHKVSDELYRGAQPTTEGMKQLKELGIKTVVNLRSLHSDRDELGDTKLGYEHIKMTTISPEDKDVIRFLEIVTDSNCTPVFVHCQHGSDRTGIMCAIYRIAVQGWTKDEAIMEMTKGDFGFHKIWMNLVDYVQELDIGEIKKSAGLE